VRGIASFIKGLSPNYKATLSAISTYVDDSAELEFLIWPLRSRMHFEAACVAYNRPPR